ncbi:hypothetical protein [Actinomadura violacea]|uniref:Uncharacterized protein n=1 Tax=Actinomadura violacea TaxID=2819934 RepID=A0ABS3S365_9ACTN|nr:hypothetical protein [Actinomadura violacea]MBO2463456.1 hypothetical protein [Actinomadura violacea]
MTFRGGRQRGAREEAARFETRLTAFGELLAAHPFSADRPDATHEMAVEYARALDAYEAAKRAAARDLALAGRELAAGLTALNRLNAHLVGTATPEAPAPAVAKPEARRPEPQVEAEAEAAPVKGPHEVRGPDVPRPRAPGDRARPRLRDRYTSGQLAKRTGVTVAAVYLLVLAVLGSWWLALVGLMALMMGGGLALFGGLLGWTSVTQIVGAVRGGLVSAEYVRTTKKVSYALREAPYQHFYLYVGADGEKVTYQRDALSPSLAALPTRRLWLVKGGGRTGMETHLSGLLVPPLMFLLLAFGVPLFLFGTVAVLYACPGLLIRALAG